MEHSPSFELYTLTHLEGAVSPLVVQFPGSAPQ